MGNILFRHFNISNIFPTNMKHLQFYNKFKTYFMTNIECTCFTSSWEFKYQINKHISYSMLEIFIYVQVNTIQKPSLQLNKQNQYPTLLILNHTYYMLLSEQNTRCIGERGRLGYSEDSRRWPCAEKRGAGLNHSFFRRLFFYLHWA